MPQRNGIKARNALGQATASIPSDLAPSVVIHRYLSDERTADIAASYGVARSRLNQWLLQHAEEPWRQAQVARAITAKEQAQDDLDEAQDPLTLARARERLRGAQWDLERLLSRLFGPKQEVTIDHRITVEHSITDSADLLLASYKRGVQDTLHNARSHALAAIELDPLRDDNARKLDNESMLSLPCDQQAEGVTILPDQAPSPGEKGSSKP